MIILAIARFTVLALFLSLHISTNNGVTISVRQVNDDGFGDQNNNYAFAMEEYDGSLYVATNNVLTELGMAAFFLGLPFESDGTQIWKGIYFLHEQYIANHIHQIRIYPGSKDIDGDYTWENVVTGGLGNQFNYGIRKMHAIGNFMYAVTSNHVTGFEIWRTNDGQNWTVQVSGGFGDTDNKSGRGLGLFNGYIYVGVENRVSGGKIYRRQINESTGDYAPNSTWTMIVDNGNGNPFNWWFSDLVQFTGLFISLCMYYVLSFSALNRINTAQFEFV